MGNQFSHLSPQGARHSGLPSSAAVRWALAVVLPFLNLIATMLAEWHRGLMFRAWSHTNTPPTLLYFLSTHAAFLSLMSRSPCHTFGSHSAAAFLCNSWLKDSTDLNFHSRSALCALHSRLIDHSLNVLLYLWYAYNLSFCWAIGYLNRYL